MKSVFSEENNIRTLLNISGELADVAGAAGVLSWDQETYMPVEGAETRAHQLATLSGIYHEKLISNKTKSVVLKFNRQYKYRNEYDEALVREFKREYTKAVKLPTTLVKEISKTISQAFESWRTAKEKSDFLVFLPDLKKLLSLKIKAANLLKTKGQSVYDVMLDEHEEGLTEGQVEKVFTLLKNKLTPLAAKLAKVTDGADTFLTAGKFEFGAQERLGMEIAKNMGYDLKRGRQDKSPHPFTINFSSRDVRITTWQTREDLRPALFATIHEAGHALYEQGVDSRLDRTHLGGGMGLVTHESQSRLWENMIGRSAEFWQYYLPKFRREFKELKSVRESDFVRAVNMVKPSLIRVEADEVTYGLHIILRFEIERDLVAGKIKPEDLPRVWNEKMTKLLGITPKNDREGVLQDVHWSHGSFGYFPTYLLGTMTAAQFFRKMKQEIKVGEAIKSGNLMELREWLKQKIHKWGRLYTADDLLVRVTREKLNPEYFMEYLEEKFSRIYGK